VALDVIKRDVENQAAAQVSLAEARYNYQPHVNESQPGELQAVGDVTRFVWN
jgi:hypothetical protein